MKIRNNTELLYESEATLRMLDSVIDELRVTNLQAPKRAPSRAGEGCIPPGAEEVQLPSDRFVRTFWKVHEIADLVEQSRSIIEQLCQDAESANDAERRRERMLLLVDRLPAEEGDPAKGRAIQRELRSMILAEPAPAHDSLSDGLSTLSILLAETEARLTRLGRLLD